MFNVEYGGGGGRYSFYEVRKQGYLTLLPSNSAHAENTNTNTEKGDLTMSNYVVTYRIGEPEKIVCAVMTGNELARTYGFSDCTGIEVLRVWEVQADGNLIECAFGGSIKAPLNWIQVFNPDTMSDIWYEWDEH